MYRKLPKSTLTWINYGVIVGTLLIASMLLLTRIPGMTILGFSPQWLLMWVIAWSVKRDILYALLGAIAVGWLHDSLTISGIPSHIPGFLLVAFLTASWRQQRYLQEDFISLALLVFAMTFVAEMVMAVQYLMLGLLSFSIVWTEAQQVALASAVLSSLWAPITCTPLVRWWDQVRMLDKQ